MTSSHLLHSQLSSIMEAMARSALTQVCRLVDDDEAELRRGLSRLLAANSALTEQVNSLECELKIVRSDAPGLCRSSRSVGVQTVCHRDGDAHVSGYPTIEAIHGKDWCVDLWSRDSAPPQSSEESVGVLSNQMTVTEIKEVKDCVEEDASSCQPETLGTEEHEEILAEEPGALSPSAGCSADGSACSLSFERDEEQVLCTGGTDEPTMPLISINDTDEAFSSHVILIEEEEEEDGVQFVEESQPTVNAEDSTALDKDAPDDSDMLDVETAQTMEKFPCQLCGMTFFHKGTLTKHMKGHKSNFCMICKWQFTSRYKFKSHACVSPASRQSDSKSCQLCRKVFRNATALRIHSFVHTGEKPHRCSLCGKGFTQKGNLKCHLRIHTGDRPFCCVKCGRTFTQKINLSHHLRAHRNQERADED